MCVCSARRNQAPLADAFPDPAGRHPPSPAVPPGLGHGVRGPRGVVLRHQLAVVRHEVALQLVHVPDGQRQEELDATEDVQQRLRSADRNSHTSAVLRGGGTSHSPALSLAPPSPPPWFSHCCGHFHSSSPAFKRHTHTHISRPDHMTAGGVSCDHICTFLALAASGPGGRG